MAFHIPRDPEAFGRIRVALRHHLKHHGTFEVVGVSGGADSLALAAACSVEAQGVRAVIVDHQLQEGSAEVARTAAAHVRAMGLDATVETITVPGNGEAAARKARYQALRAHGQTIATAHTLDDQAETFLVAAARGNPGGMLPVRAGVHRPLLDIRRADTHAACAELGLDPWHDPHNTQDRFLRVRIRELLDDHPATPALAHAARRAAADREAVATWAGRIDPTDVHALAEVPEAVRREAITAFIRDCGGAPTGTSISMVEALVTDWKGQGEVQVGGGISIARRGWRLGKSNQSGTI